MNLRPLRLCFITAFAGMTAFQSSVHGQTSGTVRLHVVDQATRLPIFNATVALHRISSTAAESLSTDSSGHFERTLTPGDYEIIIKHLGYAQHTDSVVIQSGLSASLSIALRVVPVPLDSLEARTPARSFLGGFWQRRDRNMGYYFTREDIEKARPMRTADLFRRVPGAKVLRGPNGLGQLVTFERYRRIDGSICAAMLFVDGRAYIPSAAGLDDFPPDEVEAIEAYSGSSRVPAEFNAVGKQRGIEPRCGVIVIWTRGSK